MRNKRLRIDPSCSVTIRQTGVMEVSVSDPMFQWQTWVLWGFKDQAGLDKELRRWGSSVSTNDRKYESWSGLHIPVSNRDRSRDASIILLKEAPTDPFSIGVLCHEALHAAWTCLDNSGAAMDDDEVLCYVQQFIVYRALQAAEKVSVQPSGAASSA